MPEIARNQLVIDRAKASEGKVTFYRVAGVPGLELRVSPEGWRSWYVRYQVGRGKDRKERRFLIGDAVSIKLGQATDKAAEVRAAAQLDGKDSHADKMAPKGETFGDLFDQWLQRHAKPNTRTWALEEALYRRHIEPRLAGAAVASLRKREIIVALDSIADHVTHHQADACRSLVSRILGWAEKVDLIEVNVARGAPRYANSVARSRVLIDQTGTNSEADKELVAMWWGFDRASPQVARILRILALTGQRKGEVVGARREEFDLTARRWTIPGNTADDPGRTKNGLAHVVPLPPLAEKLFREAMADSKHESFVFPAKRSGSTTLNAPMSPQTPSHEYAVIRDTLGLSGITVHDLRRTVNTGLVRIGVRPEIADAVLNHVSARRGATGVSATYNRYQYEPEKRAALEAWERELLRIVGATTP